MYTRKPGRFFWRIGLTCHNLIQQSPDPQDRPYRAFRNGTNSDTIGPDNDLLRYHAIRLLRLLKLPPEFKSQRKKLAFPRRDSHLQPVDPKFNHPRRLLERNLSYKPSKLQRQSTDLVVLQTNPQPLSQRFNDNLKKLVLPNQALILWPLNSEVRHIRLLFERNMSNRPTLLHERNLSNEPSKLQRQSSDLGILQRRFKPTTPKPKI